MTVWDAKLQKDDHQLKARRSHKLLSAQRYFEEKFFLSFIHFVAKYKERSFGYYDASETGKAASLISLIIWGENQMSANQIKIASLLIGRRLRADDESIMRRRSVRQKSDDAVGSVARLENIFLQKFGSINKM